MFLSFIGDFLEIESKPFPYKDLKPNGDKPAVLKVHGVFVNDNGLSEMGRRGLQQIVDNIELIRYARVMKTVKCSTTSQHVIVAIR